MLPVDAAANDFVAPRNDPDADVRTWCNAVPATDPDVAVAVQAALDEKTKPPGSLGALEAMTVAYAAARGQKEPPRPVPDVIVMAADHGVAAAGVSAYPQAVTAQMVANFARGGAAVNVLARHVGAHLWVIDVGVASPIPNLPGVVYARVGPGTADLRHSPAMSRGQAAAAIGVGVEAANRAIAAGATLLALGEMGIGNTTAASAVTAALTGHAAAAVVGRGTGIDDVALAHKIAAVEQALATHDPDPRDPLGVLATLGGFELAGLVGVALGAAAQRVPVVTDGFITTAAMLVAVRLCPALHPYIIASHRSQEPGHKIQLDALGLKPPLELDMRLGEGTGAVLTLGLIDAGVRILHEMATFAAAGVSKRTTGG